MSPAARARRDREEAKVPSDSAARLAHKLEACAQTSGESTLWWFDEQLQQWMSHATRLEKRRDHVPQSPRIRRSL